MVETLVDGTNPSFVRAFLKDPPPLVLQPKKRSYDGHLGGQLKVY